MRDGSPVGGSRARRTFALVALAAAALTLVVIVASAYMRHAQAGLSCPAWPECYARVASGPGDEARASGVPTARIAHRLAATLVTGAIALALLLAWMQRPAWRREGRLVATALLIVAALAVLGIATPGARLPAVVLGNLLGGYLLLAVLAAAGAAALDPAPAPARARTLALAALAVAFAQATLGGLIGAQYAALTCPGLTDCGAWSWREFATGGSWSPLRAPVATGGHYVAAAGAAGLHVLHRVGALAVAALALAVAVALWRARPRFALVLVAALGIAAGLGIAAAATGPTLGRVVLHNAAAALLIALLAAAAGHSRR